MEYPLLTGHFLKWEAEDPNALLFRQPFGGVWKTWTYAEAGNECRRMAQALHSMGLKPGDHVALLSKNCAHWIMADLAIMMAGCVSIPIYPTLSAEAIQPILEHSDAKAIFVGKLDDFASQKDAIADNLITISIGAYGITAAHTWEKLVAANEPVASLHTWGAKDIFTIIYTSGTTGKSKGVMHRVESLETVGKVAMAELNLPRRPDLFSYLPLSHIAERLGIEFYGMISGACISFAESLDTFAHNLADTQPHLFFAVPRIWGKFREGVLAKMPQKKLDTLLGLPIIGGIVKKKIKKKLGLGRSTHNFSAAAPISLELLLWFDKLGIVIYQALGMTEDSVYAHFCGPGRNKYGTVGKPFKGLQVKFSPEGELRVKSVGNMEGYYKEPELTAETFDEEGFLKTGDMAEYDHEGFLSVTGRVKDQFKTDKGKYIAPGPIETKLLANPVMEQVCVVGTGIPQPIALVVLSEAGKKMEKEALIQNLSASLATVNEHLEKFEKLEKAVIMQETWTIDNGLLTPTMKVKRNQVEKIHMPRYPGWFDQKGKVIWEE